MLRRVLFGVLAASALTATAAGQAAAQGSAPPVSTGPAATVPPQPASNASTAPQGAGTSAGEVVVTARKRAETVRSIPATVTAVTSSQLQNIGPVSGTGDLFRTVPGVRFNDLESPNLSEISIRGSGTERATGADSAVGLFVNGAYEGTSTLGGRNFTTLDLFDLDRVEVLEGPQGALYGRNAEYGVVNIVEAQPVFKDTGFVDETFLADLNQNRISGVVNHPINDDFAVRIGAEAYSQTRGFYYNPISGKFYDSTDGYLVRGQVRYKHGPLDVDLLLDAQDLNLPTFVNSYVLPPGKSAQIPLGYTGPRFDVPDDGVNATNQRVERAQLLANYDLGWGMLTSTTMLRRFVSEQQFGGAIDLGVERQLQKQGEIGVYPLGQALTDVEDRTLYQDVHLAGSAFANRLSWIGGGEVLWQRDHSLLNVATSPCALTATSGICGGTPTMPFCDRLLPTSKPCPTPFPLAFGTSSFTPEVYVSEALYGSLKYQLGAGFALSAEGRVTNDDKHGSQSATLLYTTTPSGKPSSQTFSGVQPSYTATLSYTIPGAWRDLLYAKVGSGYRAGGINAGTSSPFAPQPFQPAYGDEVTTSYETGLKGNLTSHVYFVLDSYFSRTANAIASITDGCSVINACLQGPTVFNINAGTVHAYGIEASVNGNFHVWGGALTLDGSIANQRAQYVSLPGVNPGLPKLGSLVAQIPNVSTSFTFNYVHPIVDRTDAFLNIVYNGQSGGGQDTVTTAVPFDSLSSLSDVSLRTGIDYKRIQVAFFVQNLTNETVALLKLQSVGIPLNNRYNEPRTYGVDLSYKW